MGAVINPRKPLLGDLRLLPCHRAPAPTSGLTDLGAGLNGHAGSGFRLRLNRLVDRLGQLLLGGVAHRLGPNVKSPLPAWGNFPETPDAFPLIVCQDKTRRACQYTVWSTSIVRPLPGIDLGSGNRTRSGSLTFAGHHPLAKCQMQLHLVSAREVEDQKESLLKARRGNRLSVSICDSG